MKQTKKHLFRTITVLAVLILMLASGLGSVKSYACVRGANHSAHKTYVSVHDKIVRGMYRAEDVLYKSYLENVYRMVAGKRYEFAGPTVLKIAENTNFLKRNFCEETMYSDDEGAYYIKKMRMDKAVMYWNDEDVPVIMVYYKNRNDRKPSYVGYRFEKGLNGEACGFFYYDLNGKLADVSTNVDYKSLRCNLYKAESSYCGYLLDVAYNLVDCDNFFEAGPSVVKVALNTSYLKRKYTEEIVLASDLPEGEGFYVLGTLMKKTVHYWDENGALITNYYKNVRDMKPSYVGYRYQNKSDSEKVRLITYDMNGECVEEWMPNPEAFYPSFNEE